MADEHRMEYKAIPALAWKVLDEDQGVVEHIVAVMGNVDLGGDIIRNGAFKKTIHERMGKIRVVDNHNYTSVMNVVGKPIAMWEVERDQLPLALVQEFPDATGALMAKTQFLMSTPEGRGIFERIKSGAVGEYSIGYDALDTDFEKVNRDGKEITVRNLRTIRLLEYSAVIFAMNPATQTLNAKEGKPAPDVTENTIRIRVRDPGDFQDDSFRTINVGDADNGIQAVVGRLEGETSTTVQSYIFDKERWTVARAQAWVDDHEKAQGDEMDEKETEKAVGGATGLPLASRDRAWDGGAAVGRVRSWAGAEDGPNAKYRRAFLWYDAENADNFTAYKLPFADVIDGTLHAIPRGLFAVAAVLQGSRGGADIPAGDVGGVKSRVESYYAKMRREFDDDSIEVPWKKASEEEPETKDGEDEPDEEKAGRVLAARNAQRVTTALRTLIEVLDDAGIEMDALLGRGKQDEDEEDEEDEEKGTTTSYVASVLFSTPSETVGVEKASLTGGEVRFVKEFYELVKGAPAETRAAIEEAVTERKEQDQEQQAGPDGGGTPKSPPTSSKDANLLKLIEVAQMEIATMEV